MAQEAPGSSVSLCEIAQGLVEPQTEVEIEGRYLSDFHHGSFLRAGNCEVHVGVRPDVGGGAEAEAFANATWRKIPRPDLWGRTNVTVRLRGRVATFELPMFDGARVPAVEAFEVLNVNVQEDDRQ